MRATVMHAAGDVRTENVPDATIVQPTDAVIRVSRACICGSDLWPYRSMQPSDQGQRMGHEAIGVVEAIGTGVRTMKRGDVVVMPFAISDEPASFVTKVCQPRASTSVSSATMGMMVPRPKPFAFRMRMEHCSPYGLQTTP